MTNQMSRDKLHRVKARVRSGEWSNDQETRQLILALVLSNLHTLDELEGGKSTQELREELKERERQVKLALEDLRPVLEAAETDLRTHHEPDESLPLTQRALFILDLIMEMLKAKGPKWHREWSWYTPRLEEEFDASSA